ncbi:hypothetical protein ACFVP3_39510 [Streptomyces sp. NPDC057806]|uniref:hypothetical protein n=1 Tax=Streptomyces sp. NPDC057806 TaxID=3346255 RepID=UPI003694A619
MVAQRQQRAAESAYVGRGRRMLATLARVPEIEGTFLEIETLVDENDLTAALDDIGAVLDELGITPKDLTRDTYTDAAQRH